MPLFDTHAHYNDPRFDEDRDALLSSLTEPCEICPSGVEGVINIGCCAASSRDCRDLAEKYPYIYFAAGIHPQEAASLAPGDLDEIERLLSHPKCVALGEIGLDYHWPTPTKEEQQTLFRDQLALAIRTDKPVIIHDRDAHGDLFEILREYPEVRGVFHSYSGSGEMARQLVKRGWMISFSGTVTFKNANGVVKAAAGVPLDHLLLETDAPFLAPVPYRGTRNDSRKAYATAAKLAELHGVSIDELLEITARNARVFFGM